MAEVKRNTKKGVLLPLLHVLKSLKPDYRVIILSHLDDATRDAIYKTITQVLSSDKVPAKRRLYLKSRLSPYKNHLRYLATCKPGKRCQHLKKKRLTQIGGGPMSHVLKTAIPLLLNLFPK
jgi:hypothetical protein